MFKKRRSQRAEFEARRGSGLIASYTRGKAIMKGSEAHASRPPQPRHGIDVKSTDVDEIDMYNIFIDTRLKVVSNPQPQRRKGSSNVIPYSDAPQEEHSSEPESAPLEIITTPSTTSAVSADVETEKRSISSEDVQIVDKSVIQEEPRNETKSGDHNMSFKTVIEDKDDDDADDWLKGDNSGKCHCWAVTVDRAMLDKNYEDEGDQHDWSIVDDIDVVDVRLSIHFFDLEKVGDKNEVLGGMDDRGVDDCRRSNGNMNEMNLEEHNVMKSSQETPIKSHADENAEMSNRDSGNPEVEVKSNFADKCNSSMNCDNDKGDGTDTENIKITSSMSYASIVKNDDIPQNLDYIPTVINEEGIEVVIFDDALVRIMNVPLEAWCLEGISALASSLGRPILMDSMTVMMCHKGVGNLGFARVLVEMEAIKELKMEIEIQYMDKENNIKGSKKVQVKYDWKPPVCTHCEVSGHESKHCNKGSNADKGKLDYDDYNHSKERNNVEGNCGENQLMNDVFVMQNKRRMYNKDTSKKGNPSNARSIANN
ncbi:ATPase, F1/V1/A1 complex, alpha/beta subunit, partial [Tanacetum coccineum]